MTGRWERWRWHGGMADGATKPVQRPSGPEERHGYLPATPEAGEERCSFQAARETCLQAQAGPLAPASCTRRGAEVLLRPVGSRGVWPRRSAVFIGGERQRQPSTGPMGSSCRVHMVEPLNRLFSPAAHFHTWKCVAVGEAASRPLAPARPCGRRQCCMHSSFLHVLEGSCAHCKQTMQMYWVSGKQMSSLEGQRMQRRSRHGRSQSAGCGQARGGRKLGQRS